MRKASLITGCLLILGLASLAIVQRSSWGRELRFEEALMTRGTGTGIANRSCGTNAACLTNDACAGQEDLFCANYNYTDAIGTANNTACNKVDQGKMCTEGSPNIDCANLYECSWDAVEMVCKKGPTITGWVRNPSSCSAQ